MRTIAAALLVSIACTAGVGAQANLSGDWDLAQDVYGTALHRKLVLKVDGD